MNKNLQALIDQIPAMEKTLEEIRAEGVRMTDEMTKLSGLLKANKTEESALTQVLDNLKRLVGVR